MQAQRDADDGPIEWTLRLRHSLANQLRARLLVTDTKDRSAGKCSVEVWAEEDYGDERVELAYCRGMVCPRESRAVVLWLGRSDTRPVHQRARGRRCVQADAQNNKANSPEYTLAEALFGLVAAIASLFRVAILELQAKDNGSGKLIDFYLRLGFSKRPQAHGEILWMEAPIEVASRTAPSHWLAALVPASFDACTWMQGVLEKLRFKAVLKKLFQEPLRWNASEPSGARVIAKLSPTYGNIERSSAPTRVMVEISLIDPYDEPLAWASANVRLDHKFCRVIWLGRQRSQPVHKKVRGRRIYQVHPRPETESSSSEAEQTVTVAIALLGVLAALGTRLGVDVLHMQVLDDGSGKLVRYFRSFGFADPLEGPGAVADSGSTVGQPFLTTACHTLVQRCLPVEWEHQLPPGGVHAAPEAPACASTSAIARPEATTANNVGCTASSMGGATSDSAKVSGRSSRADVSELGSQPSGRGRGRTVSPAALPGNATKESRRPSRGSSISSSIGRVPRSRAAHSAVSPDALASADCGFAESTATKEGTPRRNSTVGGPQFAQTASPFVKASRQLGLLSASPPQIDHAKSSPHLRPGSASDMRSQAREIGGRRILSDLLDESNVRDKEAQSLDARSLRTDGFKAADPLGGLKELARKRRQVYA